MLDKALAGIGVISLALIVALAWYATLQSFRTTECMRAIRDNTHAPMHCYIHTQQQGD